MLGDGSAVELDLRCRRSQSGIIRWQASCFFEAVGLMVASKNTSVNIRYKDHLAEWDARLQSLGFDLARNRGESMEALRCCQQWDALEDAEQEYWLSTVGLLVALQGMHKARRTIMDRDRVRLVLVKLLAKATDSQYLEKCFEERSVDDDVLRLCQKLPRDANGRCRCLTHKLRSFEATSDEMYCVRVAEALIEGPRWHDCPAVAKLVGVWVFAVASLIDDNVGAWEAVVPGDIRLGPSGRKRRRVVSEVKNHVLSLGSGDGCSTGAGVVGKL